MILFSRFLAYRQALAMALAFMAATISFFAHGAEADVAFDIARFQIEGNTLLSPTRADQLVAPFVGRKKVYGDIQKALEALDNEYRRLGYGTVNVYVPEQELTSGVVRLQVSEGVVGKVTITGNKHFSDENIRASLPQLREGTTPNMRQMSENIQLANENPAKQVDVTLGVAEEEGKVNAKVEVTEEVPSRYYVTLDNTGTTTSGRHRVGVSYQNANIFDRDQTLTLNYITTPDQPSGVKVDIFSAGYRIPLYALGDAIDIIYANSSTNTPATVLAPGGTLGVNGKGQVYALRYNHILPRQGEFSSRLVAGFDYKFINATCTNAGTPVAFGTSASCTPYTVRPASLTYSGNWQRPGKAIDFNLGLATNLPMGVRYRADPTGFDRYSFVTGRPTNDRFTILRLGGSYTGALPQDFLLRAAVTGQYARNALVSGEQIGLAGSSAVRGFYERGVAADRGYYANIELYSPELAPLIGLGGNLKALAFYDFAGGDNLDVASTTAARVAHIASVGVGIRYNLKKDISFKLDIASVLDGHRADATTGAYLKRDILGHFSFAYGF